MSRLRDLRQISSPLSYAGSDPDTISEVSRPGQVPADYRSRFYRRYASTNSGVEVNEASVLATLRHDILPLVPMGRILDIGCGQGLLVGEMVSTGREAIGIDVSSEMVNLAQQRGLPVEQADIRSFLAAREGQFDGIVAIDLLEHFDKDAVLELLDVIRAGLRPHGVLVARTPNGVSPFAGRFRYGDFTHGLSYTPRSIVQLMRVTGYEDVLVRPCPPVGQRCTIGMLESPRLWTAVCLDHRDR